MYRKFALYALILVACADASSQDIEYLKFPLGDNNTKYYIKEYTNCTDFGGEPSYTMGIQTSNSQVNKGETYKLSLYITGAGIVDIGKLCVSIPRYIVQDEIVNYTTIDFKMNQSSSSYKNNTKFAIDMYPDVDTMEPSFSARLPNVLFIPHNCSSLNNYGQLKYRFGTGLTEELYFPHEIEFTISNNTPPGDHYIYLNLFYKYQDKWYNDRQVVTLHINRWYEEDIFQYLIILAAIAAVLAAIAAIIDLLYAIIKDQSK